MFTKSENEDILHSFLSTMLELPYDSIKELRNTAGNDNRALHDEASALGHARREGEQIGMEKRNRK